MWIALGIVFVLLVSLAYASLSGAPWVPTWKRDVERIAALLDLQKDEIFYELGCGDGRVCLALAKSSQARVTGIELSLIQWMVAQVRKYLSGSRARFSLGNVFSKDLSDADAVYLFLMPETYKKIAPKLLAQLRPGARVVSYVWPVPGLQIEKVDEEEGRPKLYVHRR